MAEAARWLFLLGAVPFVALGSLHAWETPLAATDEKGLSPRDAAFRDAMASQHPRLTRRTNLWLTWVGFNLSHSLGAVLFGVALILVARSRASFDANAAVFIPFAIVVSLVYLAIGLRYWFRTPNAGIAFALACFLAAGVSWWRA